MKKKITQRRVGLIRHTPPSTTALPHSIKAMTINNINIYNQMNEINVNREDIFERYEQIIRDLENVIKNLEQKNQLINGQRIRLLSQNVKLKQELQNFKENYFMADSIVKQVFLFEVVPEDDIAIDPPKYKKKCNQILEQSQLDLGNIGHFYSKQVEAELSVESAHSVQLQKTPRLNHHHSVIQCKSNNNQAPLRIFYLLILQQQNFIEKLRQLLNLCYQDDSKILLHLFPNGNQFLVGIIEKFFESVLKGQFENQSQIIQYICENPLIDMLMISLLKQSLPIENEDQNLNLGNWKRQDINHRALFQGLCNQFDLRLEEDKQNFVFRIYSNTTQKSISNGRPYEQQQQSNLLQSHITERNQIQQISLFAKGTNLLSPNEQSQQPLFRIWFDHDRIFYRTKISISPRNFHFVEEEQVDQQRSFKQTQNNQSENNQNCQIHSQVHSNFLVLRDLNRINQNRDKNRFPQQYLKCQSKNLSKNNSHCCSQYIQ